MSYDQGRWDINTGSEKLRPEDLLFRERPSTPQDCFMRARSWQKENWFVHTVNQGKVDFYNYGMELVPKENTKQNRKKLEDFWEKNKRIYLSTHQYCKEVMREFVLNQNVVSFWREAPETKMVPFLLLGEQCDYVDIFGVPRLWWNPNYKPVHMPQSNDVFQFSGMSGKDIKNRYFTGQKIELSEDWDEHFEVLTTNYRTMGFGIPDLYSVFRTLTQNESMEVGDAMLGLLSRRVVLDHKLGFELKGMGASPNAAFQKDVSIWTKKRGDALIKYFNGRYGFIETTSNFDYAQKVWALDPKLFVGTKWDTVINRLLWWGGPLGFMIVCKQPNPFLLGIFKSMSDGVRSDVGMHLNFTLNQGVSKLPMEIEVKWSDRCFLDMRLAWDMVSGLMKQGPLSLTTSLSEAGFDPNMELELKKGETANAKYMVPLLTAQGPGGHAAGRPPQKAGGVKPTGSKQNAGR